MQKRLGRQTVALEKPAVILSHAAVGGKQEGEGPLAEYFDHLCEDSFFGETTWEKAESAMQKLALSRALEKGGFSPGQMDYVLAGDLLNQCIGTSFGLRDFNIPFYGLYGACSTMGESMALGSLLIAGGFAQRLAAMTSSHFCTAERQYRMPVPYGNQRTPTVDCHGLRVHDPGRRGERAEDYHRYLRENRGQGHLRCEQHGSRHGPRSLRHPGRPLPGHRHQSIGL